VSGQVHLIWIQVMKKNAEAIWMRRAPVRIGLCIHWEQLLKRSYFHQSLDLGPVNFEMKFLQIWERWDLILKEKKKVISIFQHIFLIFFL
ncbi:hypothetical protein ACJX0J_023195, partial [Zea mays]